MKYLSLIYNLDLETVIMSGKKYQSLTHQFHFNTVNNTLQSMNLTVDANTSPYQPNGAATYIVVVISIYAMSIVLFIGSNIKRKQEMDVHDKQVQHWLEGLPKVQQLETRRYSKHVMQQRLESSHQFRHILQMWEESKLKKPQDAARDRTSLISDTSSERSRSLTGAADLDSLCSGRMSRLSNPEETELNGMDFGRYPVALSDIPELDYLSHVDTDVESAHSPSPSRLSRPASLSPLHSQSATGICSITEDCDSIPVINGIQRELTVPEISCTSFDCDNIPYADASSMPLLTSSQFASSEKVTEAHEKSRSKYLPTALSQTTVVEINDGDEDSPGSL